MITLIVVLLIIALVTIFSVQNAQPVIFTFFFWKFEASLAIVIFLSVITGILLMAVMLSSRAVRRYYKKSRTEPLAAEAHYHSIPPKQGEEQTPPR